MKYLLDTNVISELIKKEPHPGVLRWINQRSEDTLFLSAITLGELQKGISKLRDTVRIGRLQDWVDQDLAERFKNRILPIDSEVALTWGRLQGNAEQTGSPLPAMDSLIAATALTHHLVVVTRNVKDLERCQAQVFNPWQDE